MYTDHTGSNRCTAQLVNIEHEKDVIYAHVDRLVPRHRLPSNWRASDEWKKWTNPFSTPPTVEEQNYVPDTVQPRQLEHRDADEYDIERIIDHKDVGSKRNRTRSYLVRYLGYPPSEDQWHNELDIPDAKEKNRRIRKFIT